MLVSMSDWEASVEKLFFFNFHEPGRKSNWMVPSLQAYRLKLHQTAAMYCHRSSHQTCLPPSHVFNYLVLNRHTCLFMRLGTSSHVCYLHCTSNNVCFNWHRLTGMLGTVALDQQAYLSCAQPVCMSVLTCTRPPIIVTGSANIFTSTHV